MVLLTNVVVFIVACAGVVSGCPDRLDLAFVIDGSGSVGYNNWMIVQDFLVDIIMRLRVDENHVRVGMVTYSSNAATQWNLGGHETFSATSLAKALGRLSYPGGYTATPEGLRHSRTDVITANDGRSNVTNVVVVITDGQSNRPVGNTKAVLRTEANQLKSIARVVVIGVGSIDRQELELIASSPCDVYTVNDFSQMNDNMPARMDQICGCMPGYMRSGTCQCVACQMNMYQPDWGQIQCLQCPSQFTAMSSMASLQCIRECSAGSMIDSTGQRCVLCPQNQYQPLENQHRCVPCESGKATRGVGATSEGECEIICEPGEQPSHSGGCESCPIGTYQPSAFSTMCIECPNGFSTRNNGSITMAQCIAICNSGSFADADNMCMSCPIGKYQDMTLAEVCTDCPNGTSTRQTGSMSKGDCKVVCPPGQHADADEMQCLPCDKGYYQPEEFMQFCVKCPSGTDTPQEGMAACDRAMSGKTAGLIVGLVVFLVLLNNLLCLYCYCRRAKRRPVWILRRSSTNGDNDHSLEPRQASPRMDTEYDVVNAADEKEPPNINRGIDTYDSPRSNHYTPDHDLYINT